VHVRDAAAADATVRKRRPFTDEDSAGERRGNERRYRHATEQMRLLCKR
jgi:hypothetical protein